MTTKLGIFSKINLLILLILAPVIILYGFSNRVSTTVVEEEIRSNNLNRQTFFLSQMETMADQLSMFSLTLSRDSDVLDFMNFDSTDMYDSVQIRSKLKEKLQLQSIASGWISSIAVYSPPMRQSVTTFADAELEWSPPLISQVKGWQFRQPGSGSESPEFVRQTVLPANAVKQPQKARLVIETRLEAGNIQKMLDDFKLGGKGDPFFYHPDYLPILNHSANSDVIRQIGESLRGRSLPESGSTTITVDGRSYLTSYIHSDTLGWYLIDYISLKDILSPIDKTRNLFYACIGLLVLLGILASLLLYRHVQIPIRELIKGVQKIKRGDLSTRLSRLKASEFGFLFERFNDMAAQIQELIENIYAERIRSREATLKQLQAQINPHFLYNSLFFIKNAASVGNTKLAVSMSLNLGEYYRYSTRLEKQEVSVREEAQMVRNYLSIQQLRQDRLHYFIHIPESILDLPIPRLILQPVVENAVVHGIESKLGNGLIWIWGGYENGMAKIVVEDNGKGMVEEYLLRLREELRSSMDDETGCGLWNVHQRLVYRYGEHAGVELEPSWFGGLRVTILLTGNTATTEK